MESLLPWIQELRGVRLGAEGPEFSAESLRLLLENLPVAVSITAGGEHRFIYANRLYREILQPHAGDPVGRTVGEVFGPLYTSALAALRDRALARAEPVTVREVSIRLGESGRQMYWDASLIPIMGEGAVAEGLLTLGIEVTQKVLARREAERQAAESAQLTAEAQRERQRLELAADATNLGIWEWEVESGRLYWSERQKALWGFPPDHPAVYEDWESRLHPEDREAVLGRVQAVLDPASGGNLLVQHRIVRLDGETRWISGQARMVYDESGRPVRLIGTALDVTERIEADEELRRALAARETLLSELNHRVKNSLALVSSMLSLQVQAIPDEATRRLVEDAHSRVHTVALVHERLYRAGEVGTVELDAYLDALCRDVERAGTADRQALRVELAAEPVTVSNDRAVPVALILNELLTNAVKYAYPGGSGTVWVELAALPSGEARLVVRDVGAGLPPDFAERQGRSLGFRIIEGLVGQIRGSFEIGKPEAGAAFSLTFPTQ